jgi:uncharacterized membrane protein
MKLKPSQYCLAVATAGSLMVAESLLPASLKFTWSLSAIAAPSSTTTTPQPTVSPLASPTPAVMPTVAPTPLPDAATQQPLQAPIKVPAFPNGNNYPVVQPPWQLRLQTPVVGSEALGVRSGGRSGGGSFQRPSAPAPSQPSYTPSYPRRDPYYPPYSGGGYRGGGPVVVPIPGGAYGGGYSGGYGSGYGGSYGYSSGGGLFSLLILGIVAAIVVFSLMNVLRSARGFTSGGVTQAGGELLNDKVTVSKVQVALLSQAREVQADLTRLSLSVDTDTNAGLLQLLQESALSLLRMPENWSHALVMSQTVNGREAAGAVFNRLSIAERSKYTVETLTNVGGRVNRKSNFTPDPNKDPASFIVVTLLVGTAHDRPLFNQVHTTQELQAALQALAGMPAEYLMAFELIWTPQDENDSLTYDELLAQYADMVQI